ncbi:MAG: DUF998 domain-containing protein [Zoogloeaceae bacterium]|jgi:hypothetical protein|nr:DUF998 domain-containing protein [Zoogloeaceae bacterium]
MHKKIKSTLIPRLLSNRVLSVVAAIGIAVFVIVVLLLHLAQLDYDPLTQFISELALGRFGGFLVVAFIGLAIAVAATGTNLRIRGSPLFLSLLLGSAALCFLAAGFITLVTSTQAHVLLVALAFVLCGVSMYALPRTVTVFSGCGDYLASWGCCLLMCGATGLGDSVVLVGVAQRLSAIALLFWLSFVTWRLAR